MYTRRQVIRLGLMSGIAANLAAAPQAGAAARSKRGAAGQHAADQGDGRYLNPILADDHPDPTVLKDGDAYYMIFTSFESAPALTIWHSRDLVNWLPLGPALQHPPGKVFAVDLCKHAGRYFIYLPVIPNALSEGLRGPGIFVIHADHITGPWSEPISPNVSGHIDPGHVVGEDGKRYLFLSGISRVALSDDGLATAGPSSMSTMAESIRATGWWKAMRWKGPSCCAAAAGSI
ncbi:MAG: family 43 glycosylhydrolase [Sphingomonadaceae bacterium]